MLEETCIFVLDRKASILSDAISDAAAERFQQALTLPREHARSPSHVNRDALLQHVGAWNVQRRIDGTLRSQLDVIHDLQVCVCVCITRVGAS